MHIILGDDFILKRGEKMFNIMETKYRSFHSDKNKHFGSEKLLISNESTFFLNLRCSKKI